MSKSESPDRQAGTPDSGGSPWRHADDPPQKDEWVIVSADGMVRCVAWNNAVKQWQDWNKTGIIIEEIDWWMSIPPLPSANLTKQRPADPAKESS